MSVDINTLFEMLSWNSDEETQKRGIEEAKKIKAHSVLILPSAGKCVWENCAKALVQFTDSELEFDLYRLFEWLRDPNWPGSEIIEERLMTIPAQFILSSYSNSIAKAQKLGEGLWLNDLSRFIENEELYSLLTKEQRELMEAHYSKSFHGDFRDHHNTNH